MISIKCPTFLMISLLSSSTTITIPGPTSLADKPIEQQVGHLLDQRRVVAASEDRTIETVVDFGKKPGKRELQQWMESNFLEAAVAPGKKSTKELDMSVSRAPAVTL